MDRPEEKDLTTEEGVRDALSFETVSGQGRIARVWNEYLQDAFARVNDVNARKIVLYLARHEPEQRTRRQIREDLSLTMTEGQLDKRMKQLVMADILAQGSSDFRYRGLGDRVFAMVFRRIYSEEIEELDDATVENNFKRELAALKGQLSVHKGSAAEYRVRYRLLVASLRSATLADVVQDSEDASAPQTPLGPFAVIRKARFYIDHDRVSFAPLRGDAVEIDLHAAHENDDGTDLMIEVKDWETEPSLDAVRRFVAVKNALDGRLERSTVFLFYSESGLGEDAVAALYEAGVLVLDPAKLAAYEASFQV